MDNNRREGYCIRKTNAWPHKLIVRRELDGDYTTIDARKIASYRPFVDHTNSDGGFFAYRRKGSKGQPKFSQMFILSYAYKYDHYRDDKEFVDFLDKSGMRMNKKPCLYRGEDAYRIIIANSDVDMEHVVELLDDR